MQKNFMTITQAKLKWFRDEIKYNYRFPQSYRYLRAFVVTFTGIQKKLTELVSEATFFTFHILKPIPVGRKCKQKQTSKYHSSCALKEARKPLQVLKRAKIISNCDLSPNFFWITYSNRENFHGVFPVPKKIFRTETEYSLSMIFQPQNMYSCTLYLYYISTEIFF